MFLGNVSESGKFNPANPNARPGSFTNVPVHLLGPQLIFQILGLFTDVSVHSDDQNSPLFASQMMPLNRDREDELGPNLRADSLVMVAPI